ncbi:hypothetical protein JG687_00019430 [Phytophthora cactorum]|uniref:Uncharacterized protein n=1 Tax=Phytophthora cactorum TaxID=29920 RepID=A0A8T1TJ10_9STRA|nr:hypothetical protein PC120_g2390 [Phytophthora cactorum]KAG3087507.1 hypothetical protein PC121_g4590 [Phytophthora cactorum]KAG4062285.1 hypothetical protein PC123_g2845 [Phytophthora cactorum]KAG6941808.1 hypothetical protein JG687_00019430 [Phytophthora cactorum]
MCNTFGVDSGKLIEAADEDAGLEVHGEGVGGSGLGVHGDAGTDEHGSLTRPQTAMIDASGEASAKVSVDSEVHRQT